MSNATAANGQAPPFKPRSRYGDRAIRPDGKPLPWRDRGPGFLKFYREWAGIPAPTKPSEYDADHLADVELRLALVVAHHDWKGEGVTIDRGEIASELGWGRSKEAKDRVSRLLRTRPVGVYETRERKLVDKDTGETVIVKKRVKVGTVLRRSVCDPERGWLLNLGGGKREKGKPAPPLKLGIGTRFMEWGMPREAQFPGVDANPAPSDRSEICTHARAAVNADPESAPETAPETALCTHARAAVNGEGPDASALTRAQPQLTDAQPQLTDAHRRSTVEDSEDSPDDRSIGDRSFVSDGEKGQDEGDVEAVAEGIHRRIYEGMPPEVAAKDWSTWRDRYVIEARHLAAGRLTPEAVDHAIAKARKPSSKRRGAVYLAETRKAVSRGGLPPEPAPAPAAPAPPPPAARASPPAPTAEPEPEAAEPLTPELEARYRKQAPHDAFARMMLKAHGLAADPDPPGDRPEPDRDPDPDPGGAAP